MSPFMQIPMSEDKLLNSEYQCNIETSTQLLVSSVDSRTLDSGH